MNNQLADSEKRCGAERPGVGDRGARRGKSTLTRVLCTLLLPSAGRARVAGYDVSLQAGQVRLHMLRELMTSARPLDERIGTYSGGMKRRLDLALALVHDPEVLFLDEPTTGLDPVSRAAVWQEVRRLNSELGMTVFLTTQYLEEADTLAERVGIINHGRIAAEGTLEEQVLTARVSDGASALSPIAVALAGLDRVQVSELSLRRPTLDDVFLSVTGEQISVEEDAAIHADDKAGVPA